MAARQIRSEIPDNASLVPGRLRPRSRKVRPTDYEIQAKMVGPQRIFHPAPSARTLTLQAPGAILVARGQTDVSRTMCQLLISSGFSVVEAASGRGLETMERSKRPIHLLITDILMRGMNGLDLGCEVERKYPDVRMLYLSSDEHSVAARAIAKSSPESLLLIPFIAKDFLERVRWLLQGRSCRTA